MRRVFTAQYRVTKDTAHEHFLWVIAEAQLGISTYGTRLAHLSHREKWGTRSFQPYTDC